MGAGEVLISANSRPLSFRSLAPLNALNVWHEHGSCLLSKHGETFNYREPYCNGNPRTGLRTLTETKGILTSLCLFGPKARSSWLHGLPKSSCTASLSGPRNRVGSKNQNRYHHCSEGTPHPYQPRHPNPKPRTLNSKTNITT